MVDKRTEILILVRAFGEAIAALIVSLSSPSYLANGSGHPLRTPDNRAGG